MGGGGEKEEEEKGEQQVDKDRSRLFTAATVHWRCVLVNSARQR